MTGKPALMLQLVGRYGDEGTILSLGAQLEKARPWFDKRPTTAG